MTRYCSYQYCCDLDHRFFKILLFLPFASAVAQLGYVIYLLSEKEHVAKTALTCGMLFGFGIFSLITAAVGVVSSVKRKNRIVYISHTTVQVVGLLNDALRRLSLNSPNI
nr:hypothetical transcript [Hymenolepis microstoma]